MHDLNGQLNRNIRFYLARTVTPRLRDSITLGPPLVSEPRPSWKRHFNDRLIMVLVISPYGGFI